MPNWPANSETDWNTKMLAYLAIGHDTDGTHKATEVTAVVTGEGLFGSWTNKDSLNNTLVKGETYKVGSDGSVFAITDGPNGISGFTDSSNPSVIRRCLNKHADGSGITMLVKKDDYWRVAIDTYEATIYWLPIGSGTCVKQ